ncbi:hypothetical protein CERZMDRAFT_98761 [Cercospora zeae-maydis SCOH1-5]|uniref:Myb-like domain-containing protein n=1 Tax=Cercospora zeae-maydis SCOH1-5 TaxID=717836 RepID=A0A6A6FC89_9PEZI|nr:hypothetical protein CERZMDRAFT_98761 [Cercospora zeae-maydis SCOH1-5]
MLVLYRRIRTSCQIRPIELRTTVTRRWKGTAGDDIHSEEKLTQDEKYRFWTAEEERKLLELRASGLIGREIAQRLDRTVTSVRERFSLLCKGRGTDKTLTAWAQEICQQRKSRTVALKEEIDQVKACRDQNFGVRNIADRLGISFHRVNYILYRDHQSSRQRTRWTAEEEELLAELLRKGRSWTEIRALFPHRSHHSLVNHWGIICHRYPFWHEASGVPSSLRKRVLWKPAEVERLKMLREQKVPGHKIAGLLGRTTTAVRSKMYALKHER